MDNAIGFQLRELATYCFNRQAQYVTDLLAIKRQFECIQCTFVHCAAGFAKTSRHFEQQSRDPFRRSFLSE